MGCSAIHVHSVRVDDASAGDLDCLHEPFGEAGIKVKHRFGRGSLKVKDNPGLTLESVWADIQRRACEGPVFIKDFPHYINHLWTPQFLACFTHAFLIRDPAKTLTSLHHQWNDFDELEVDFGATRTI